MTKFIIYGAGFLVVVFVVGMLSFLTVENAASGQAVLGTRYGVFNISGPASYPLNAGILGIVLSLLSYVIYLIGRNSIALKTSKIMGFSSGTLILIGVVWGNA